MTTKGTDLYGESTLELEKQFWWMNTSGAIGVAVFAPLAYLCNAVWMQKCDKVSLEWGTFGYHPFLMGLAFIFFGPMAACSYRILRDVLGTSHGAAKAVHAVFQIIASVIAICGVRDVWIAHESSYHFKSTHSILGVFMLALYVAHAVTALVVFVVGSSSLRDSYHQLHMAMGQFLQLGTLFVAALGLMYFESEVYDDGWDDDNDYRWIMTVTQYMVILLFLSMILMFHARVLYKPDGVNAE